MCQSMVDMKTAWPEFLTAQANDSAAKKVCLARVIADLTAGTIFTFSVNLFISEYCYSPGNLRLDLVLGLLPYLAPGALLLPGF